MQVLTPSVLRALVGRPLGVAFSLLLLGCGNPPGGGPGPATAPAPPPPPPAARQTATPGRLTPQVFRGQLDLVPQQIESTMAALNLVAISSGSERAEAIQQFNSSFALLQDSFSGIVGEIDELEQLGAGAYFTDWPRTRLGAAVAQGATIPPEAYDPVAFEMAQLGKGTSAFLAQLGQAADEMARSPGATTPRLTELVGSLNAATPQVLESVHDLAGAIDKVNAGASTSRATTSPDALAIAPRAVPASA